MILIIFVVAVLLFPAVAPWAWRRGGGRRLTLVTVAAVSALVVLALSPAARMSW